MHILLTLLRKDIANFLRNKTALVLTFIIPVALIYIMGQVFGLNRKHTGPAGIKLAVVNESDHPAAQQLVAALRAEPSFQVIAEHRARDQTPRPLTEADARALIYNRDLRFAIVIPPDLVSDDRFGTRLRTLSDPRNEVESQMVNGLLQKTIFSSVPELLGQSLQSRARIHLGERGFQDFNGKMAATIAGAFGGDAAQIERELAAGNLGFAALQPTPPSSGSPAAGSGAQPRSNPLADLVRIENEQLVGKEVKNPEATRVIGGYAIMFLLFAISGSSAAFFDEKNAGLFQRLLSSPVTRGQLLWGRFLFGVLLGLVQLFTLFVAGSLMYDVDVFGHVGALLVVCIAAAAACAAFGMFVAAIAPNAQAASGISTFIVMMMSATGGAWFPPSLMPELMQKIGKLTIVYWSVEGFQQVLWAGNSLVQILPIAGILVAIAAGVMAIAVWRLQRKKLFE